MGEERDMLSFREKKYLFTHYSKLIINFSHFLPGEPHVGVQEVPEGERDRDAAAVLFFMERFFYFFIFSIFASKPG